MTIRFIKSWNGYYEGQIVTSPNGRSEADLVTLGYAVTDLDGPDNSPLPVTASKTLTGGMEVTAGGKDAFSGVSRGAVSGNIGIRIVGGRMANVFDNSANDRVFQAVFEVKRRVVAVSFALAQGRVGGIATNTPTISGNIWCAASFSDAHIDAAVAARSNVSFAGSGSGVLLAPTVDDTRKIMWTDFANIKHTTRADGKPGSFVGIRLLVGATPRLVMMGDGTDDFSAWETKTDGGAFHLRYRSFSSGLTLGASTYTTTPKGSPIVGVRYITDEGAVCNVMAFGDSIDEGRDTFKNEGFASLASTANIGTTVVEPSDLAWAGSGTAAHLVHLTNAIADGVIPHVAVFPSGSPNDASTTLDYVKTTAWMDRTNSMLNLCRSNGITPIVRNMTPVNNAIKAFGSTDALRVQHNTLFTAGLARAGVAVIDASAAVSGTAHASGQMELKASASLDGIHLTRAATTEVGALAAGSLALLAL